MGVTDLVNLLNSWAIVAAGGTAWAASAWEAAWTTAGHTSHAAWHAAFAARSVEFHHDLFSLLVRCSVNFFDGGTIIWG
jgi:hypothetical protein